MEYQVGDKVELEDGRIVTITQITLTNTGWVYGHGNPYCAIDKKIIRKIED